MNELNEGVKLSLEQAQASLREALGFASKAESPVINMSITQVMMGIESVLTYHSRNNHQHNVMRHLFGDDTP